MQLDSGAASDVQLDSGAEHGAGQPGHRPYARGASRPLTAFIVEMRRDAISIVEMRGTEGPSAWNSLQASAAELTPRRQRQKDSCVCVLHPVVPSPWHRVEVS